MCIYIYVASESPLQDILKSKCQLPYLMEIDRKLGFGLFVWFLGLYKAYRYVAHYKGIDMIDEHYNIMHTLDLDEMVNSLAIYCNRQGGNLL